MAALMEVRRRVAVRRVVAAADLSADHALTQVHPAVAGLQALLAAGDLVGGIRVADLIEREPVLADPKNR